LNVSRILSLVIATCGRDVPLRALLDSIPSDCADRVRIVVVDQNDDDRLIPLLASVRADLSLEHLRVPFQHASRARNLGARHASTEWVAFPDDDATFLPMALERFFALENTSLDVIGGQIVDEAGAPHLIAWLDHDAAITRDTLDFTFVESSFFIRRDVFLRIDGFDPLFGPGAPFPAAEGADLMRRLWQEGTALRTLYTPSIQLYHPEKSTDETPTGRDRVRRFAFAEGAFVARHLRVLPKAPVLRKLVLRIGGVCLTRSEKRRRKIAYLAGFFRGFFAYIHLQRARLRIEQPSYEPEQR
jgi:GT2 family glycosyltransferase